MKPSNKKVNTTTREVKQKKPLNTKKFKKNSNYISKKEIDDLIKFQKIYANDIRVAKLNFKDFVPVFNWIIELTNHGFFRNGSNDAKVFYFIYYNIFKKAFSENWIKNSYNIKKMYKYYYPVNIYSDPKKLFISRRTYVNCLKHLSDVGLIRIEKFNPDDIYSKRKVHINFKYLENEIYENYRNYNNKLKESDEEYKKLMDFTFIPNFIFENLHFFYDSHIKILFYLLRCNLGWGGQENKNRYYLFTYSRIAKKTGLDKETIAKRLKELEKLGLIYLKPIKNKNKNGKDNYYFNDIIIKNIINWDQKRKEEFIRNYIIYRINISITCNRYIKYIRIHYSNFLPVDIDIINEIENEDKKNRNNTFIKEKEIVMEKQNLPPPEDQKDVKTEEVKKENDLQEDNEINIYEEIKNILKDACKMPNYSTETYRNYVEFLKKNKY